MKFLTRLSEWGKKNLPKLEGDPEATLRWLYERGQYAEGPKATLTPEDIGAVIGGVPGRTVRMWMCIFGIPLRMTVPTILRSANRLGFKSLQAYFQKRWGRSFEQMGKELCVNPLTVSAYYGEFVSEFSGAVATKG